MLKDFYKFNLQFFADGGGDGGDGGDGGASADANAEIELTPGENEELARIPERDREMYKETVIVPKRKKASVAKTEPGAEPPKSDHIPFSELIKSDEYKEEFQTFMDKTVIPSRFKKYEDIEAKNAKMSDALLAVADKYGLDPSSDTYLDDITAKIKQDSSYIESYAMENDISVEEAKKDLDMKRKISAYETEKRQREQAQAQQYHLQMLRQNAEETKKLYPDFNLELEMQNEDFRKICALFNGDTTRAYHDLHFQELMDKQAKTIATKASQQMANSVAANRQRPTENGLSSQAALTISPNFDNMSAEELKAWGEEQRRSRVR